MDKAKQLKLESALRRKEARTMGSIERKKIKSTSKAKARVEKSKRYTEKIKEDAATTRSLARTAAVSSASTAISSQIGKSNEARYQAEIQKYAALVSGNTAGTNAIDPGKDGDNAEGGPSTSNPKPRW